MKLLARELDRRIRFERKVTQGGFMSAGAQDWVPVATVWAQVRDILPSRGERDADSIVIAQRPARIRMRFRTDIAPDMRVVFGDRVMEIVAGPVELGRRDGLELVVQDYSTAGAAA